MNPATERLLATVDRLSPAELAGSSLLPGWSRAHVVAHLTLNAEGLGRVVRGVTAGEPVTMYDSPAARDDDIAVLAGGPSDLIGPRLRAACTALAAALDGLPPDRSGTWVERTPGSGPSYQVGDVTLMRRREVEIHHVDLDAGYTTADWPGDFAAPLVESLVTRPSATGFTMHAVDLDQVWRVGPAEPSGAVVSGTAADLGWWLTGRGSGDGLTSDDGPLPRMEAW